MIKSNSCWSIERWRILLVLFLALLGGLLSDAWLASCVIVLAGYIAWLLYKLHQLNRWLENGSGELYLPDSNGVWERIVHRVQYMKKKSAKHKKRTSKLLKRLKGVVTGLPYATVVLNSNNEIDWANKFSKDFLNIDAKKDRGQRIDNLIRMPEVLKILKKNARKEIEISLPHAHDRQIAVQLIPVQEDLKLFIARDVSERNHIQQMRKNFIANASHELRTPLTVIAGYLEILQEESSIPNNLQPAVCSAAEQSARMQSIIEDLLTLSRLENSELDDESNQCIDMPILLRRICKDESTFIIDNSHTLTCDIDPDLLITGAEAEIVSVCSNLIHNAIRHTQADTTIAITWTKTKKQEACLIVSDDGQGIPAEHIPRLTERFYRVDKGRSRDMGGTGLGMAIVQHIIKRHGGHLDIQSTLGEGSSFMVCLPASRVVVGSTCL